MCERMKSKASCDQSGDDGNCRTLASLHFIACKTEEKLNITVSNCMSAPHSSNNATAINSYNTLLDYGLK